MNTESRLGHLGEGYGYTVFPWMLAIRGHRQNYVSERGFKTSTRQGRIGWGLRVHIIPLHVGSSSAQAILWQWEGVEYRVTARASRIWVTGRHYSVACWQFKGTGRTVSVRGIEYRVTARACRLWVTGRLYSVACWQFKGTGRTVSVEGGQKHRHA